VFPVRSGLKSTMLAVQSAKARCMRHLIYGVYFLYVLSQMEVSLCFRPCRRFISAELTAIKSSLLVVRPQRVPTAREDFCVLLRI
jgi:hypothetical protein